MARSASDRLLEVLAPYRAVAVVTHDNPDPDAIATGWAVHYLVRERLKRKSRLVGSGQIVRSENRYMVERLRAPLELVTELPQAADTATVLVDSSPDSENHLLGRNGVSPFANIDHHASSRAHKNMAFQDLRTDVIASASIGAAYLEEQELKPSSDLATALLYAIGTEAMGGQTQFSRTDRAAVRWLTEFADQAKLAEIRSAPLSLDYFGDLTLGLQSTFLYEDAALALLPRVQGAETVGELADLLLRCSSIRRVLSAAHVGDRVYVSVRTAPGAGDAAQLARRVLDGLGSAGGHEHRAGGCIFGDSTPKRSANEIDEELRRRWLVVCGCEGQRGKRLVARREIVENL